MELSYFKEHFLYSVKKKKKKDQAPQSTKSSMESPASSSGGSIIPYWLKQVEKTQAIQWEWISQAQRENI